MGFPLRHRLQSGAGRYIRKKGPCTISEVSQLLALVQQTAPHRYPRITDLLLQVPPWLRALGTLPGIEDFQRRHEVTIPFPLRLYFACPAVACWLQLYADTNTFFDDPAFPDPPPLLHWAGQRYVAVGLLEHSGTLIGVEVDWRDPLVSWEGSADLPRLTFSTWLTGIARQILAGPSPSQAAG